MGTGVVSILPNRLLYNAVCLYWISIIVFALNIILFVVALSISAVRYIVWPKI
jgi:tellurite resistance protein TehA-like permease